MNLRPSCPPCAGTTAGSGQPAGETRAASMRTKTPNLRAEAMPRLSPRVDAGSRRAGNPPYQHGHRRVAARRPPRAGAGPSARALPTGGRGWGRGRGHATAPGAGSAKLNGGGSPWRAGRAARRRARCRASTALGIAFQETPPHGFQHRGHGVDLLLQSRRPVAGLLRERGNARLQPGNPFTQLCHWVSKAA